MSQNTNEGVTLNVTMNGPVFGVFAVVCVWAIIIATIWASVVTDGMALILVLVAILGAIMLGIAGYATWSFYKWAARGFKEEPYRHDW